MAQAQTTYRDPVSGAIYDNSGAQIKSLGDYQKGVGSGLYSGNPLDYSKSPFANPYKSGNVIETPKKSPVSILSTQDGINALTSQKAKFDSMTGLKNVNGGGANTNTGTYTTQGNQTDTGQQDTSQQDQGGQSFTFKEAAEMFGNDFTGLKRNTDGTYTPDSSALERIGISGLNTQDTPDYGLNDQITQYDNQIEGLVNNFNNYNVDNDPAYKTAADSIKSKYAAMRDQMIRTNDQRQKALQTLGYRTGSTQYAGAIQSGIVGEEISQADKRLQEIAAAEQNAINDARTAYEDGNYKKFSQQVNNIQMLRKNKSDALAAYNQSLADAQKAQQESDKFDLEVLKYQLDAKNASETDNIKEYNYAKQSGFNGSMLDYLTYKNQTTSPGPQSFQEWTLAGGQEGTGKTYADYLKQDASVPQSYQEWQLAGGQQGTGKSYGEFIAGSGGQDPQSYREWQLAGGQEGTGKSYGEWLGKSVGDGLSGEDKQTFLGISNNYRTDTVIATNRNASLARAAAKKIEDNPNDAAAQISLLYSYIKLLDPTSTVREGELSLATSVQSFLEKNKTIIESATSGKKISPEAAKKLAAETKDLATKWADMAEKRDEEYQAQADTVGIGDVWRNYKSKFGSGLATEAANTGHPTSGPITRSYQNLNSLYLEHPDYRKVVAGIIQQLDKQNVEASDENVLQVLEQMDTSGFNKVGDDTDIQASQSMGPVSKVNIPKSSNLAYVNNNPGNLRYVNQPGAKPGKGGFAFFKTAMDGFNALVAQVKLDASRNHTLASFINKYAPPGENDTSTYQKQLASRLKVPLTTPIKNIDPLKLAKEIALKESSTKIG